MCQWLTRGWDRRGVSNYSARAIDIRRGLGAKERVLEQGVARKLSIEMIQKGLTGRRTAAFLNQDSAAYQQDNRYPKSPGLLSLCRRRIAYQRIFTFLRPGRSPLYGNDGNSIHQGAGFDSSHSAKLRWVHNSGIGDRDKKCPQ